MPPAMLRAAAKPWSRSSVVAAAERWPEVAERIDRPVARNLAEAPRQLVERDPESSRKPRQKELVLEAHVEQGERLAGGRARRATSAGSMSKAMPSAPESGSPPGAAQESSYSISPSCVGRSPHSGHRNSAGA